MKLIILFLLLSLSLLALTACQPKKSFTPLPKSASNITLIKYDGNYTNAESVILTGAKKNHLLSTLNKDGKHITPDGTAVSCPSATIQNTVYRDIIVHYNNSNQDRFF